MHRTISIPLQTTEAQTAALDELAREFTRACNRLVPVVQEKREWNRVRLHNVVYDRLRSETRLGSQFCCIAIASVCNAYRTLVTNRKIRSSDPIPVINFTRPSVHVDARTFSIKTGVFSISTLSGRTRIPGVFGEYQTGIWNSGKMREATLVKRNRVWYLNVVIDVPAPELSTAPIVVGVDVGENNVAALSTGKIVDGGSVRHTRNRFLALRQRLQANGSRSAHQRLRQVSGKESRRVRQVNHEVSKTIVSEAIREGAGTICMEDLTHIRSHIKAGKRVRARLHRWSWKQLQTFVEYKAEAAGLQVVYANPAYTSQTCSNCHCIGIRAKHLFHCPSCGLQAHADLNASRNLAWIGWTIVQPRAAVNQPDVEVGVSPLTMKPATSVAG